MGSRAFLTVPVLLTMSVALVAGASAQTTIGGVVNTYEKVLRMELSNSSTCAVDCVVEDATGFAADDEVLVIQMQGAYLNLDDSPTFGSIREYAGAGYMVIGTISSITQPDVNVSEYFISIDGFDTEPWFDATQGVQLVRVADYSSTSTTAVTEVTSTVTAQAWNGETGGVIAIHADKLVLSADVDASGAGFQGGDKSVISTGSYFQNSRGWVYTTDNATYIYAAGFKGEGIGRIDQGPRTRLMLRDRIGGRGYRANGGGGGNGYNAGGGGGGNGGEGGHGGYQKNTAGLAMVGGRGGRIVDPEQPDLFVRAWMGGGGGGGHATDSGTGGGNGGAGGGIVLIIADEVEGNGYTIMANGDVGDDGTADGAGGGGSGGMVLLEVTTYTNEVISPDLKVEVKGGGGGDAVGTASECYGTGGGGSGGYVWFSQSSTPTNLNVDDDNTTTGAPGLVGGAAGVPTNCTDPDVNSTHGASDGEKGQILYDLVIPLLSN